MQKFDQFTQILYEISMSIGTSLSMDLMLRNVALVTLRKLNGTAFVIFKEQREKDHLFFKRVYITPLSFSETEGDLSLRQILSQQSDGNSQENVYDQLPLAVKLKSGGCFHLMRLPGYGLLALFRGYDFLPKPVIYSFASLNRKLAIACQACLEHEHLEALVKARTIELEKKNKELETFAYSVAHDLKSPLRGIEGYATLLTEGYAKKLDGEGLQFLANIRHCSQHMTQLIEDLLAYSRLENRSTSNTSIDLKTLVDRVISEKKMEIEYMQIDVSVELPFDNIYSDPTTIRQVFLNFLDNAIKFKKKKGASIIEIGGTESEQDWRIWFKDNGIGFDPKFHDRIFQIFQRLNLIEEYPGTGVGLAIVRKAVEQIGGMVWAESSIGKGSTFYISVPKPYKKVIL